jgi:uncharacterized protein
LLTLGGGTSSGTSIVAPANEGGRLMTDETKMSRAEAGRKGGLTTKRRYGDEFFGKIGKIGGKKGGDTTKRRYGVEFYQKIGRKGGSR